jgi:hypothetical protein
MADYQRQYRSADEIRAAAQGFAAGVKAFREMTANTFAEKGTLLFSGVEIARVVLAAPMPKREEDKEPNPTSTQPPVPQSKEPPQS